MESTSRVDRDDHTDVAVSLKRSSLGSLSDRALAELAATFRSVVFSAGEVVVREGEPGQSLFLVLAGRAEISTVSGRSVVPLAAIGPDGLVGELALLTDDPIRRATVTALEPLHCLEIDQRDLQRALATDPDSADRLRRAADELVLARLLRAVAPLAGLDDLRARELAARVKEFTVMAGETIVETGQPSESCFVLRSGRAEVLVPDAESVAPAELRPGSLFGEVGLLAEEPRTATVRALDDCRVLVLDRDAVLEVARADPRFAHEATQLLRLRERPRQTEGIEIHERIDGGDTVTTLKDPVRGRYFRLSPLGRFVWDRLDGSRNVRDLATAYHGEQGRFAPEQIATVVAALGASGFVTNLQVSGWILPGAEETSSGTWARSTARARGLLTWHADVGGVDRAVGRLYRGGGRAFYTAVGKTVLVLVALGGFVAFLWPLATGTERPGSGRPGLLWLLIPAFFLSILIHELGHALTTKAVGREVRRAGVGWFWIGPMAYVDVSDTWLASRRERLAVAAAGPVATMALAGLAALGTLVAGPVLGGALWLFALSSYVSVLQNLNPLIELDGYYILVHWLDRPNLRSLSLAWLRDEGPRSIMHPSRLSGHGFEAAYAVASILYLIGSAALVVVLYRAVLEGWVARWLPTAVAAALGWLVAGTFVLFMLAGIIGDLRAAGRQQKV